MFFTLSSQLDGIDWDKMDSVGLLVRVFARQAAGLI